MQGPLGRFQACQPHPTMAAAHRWVPADQVPDLQDGNLAGTPENQETGEGCVWLAMTSCGL